MLKKIIISFMFLISTFGFSQMDYNQFKGEKSKIHFSNKYTFTKLYDYKVNASNADSISVTPYDNKLSESVLTKKYSDELSKNKKDSVYFSIILYSKLSIEVGRVRHDLIKFKTNKGGKFSETKVIDVIKEEGKWKEAINETEEMITLKNILMFSSVDILFQFYNSRNNPNYPEINLLKPLVKDSNDILNIDKLSRALLENQSSLSKYLVE